MTVVKVCAWCMEPCKRRTRCRDCGALLCNFDYMTHKRALENGDGCYIPMMARAERNLGIKEGTITKEQFLEACEGKR